LLFRRPFRRTVIPSSFREAALHVLQNEDYINTLLHTITIVCMQCSGEALGSHHMCTSLCQYHPAN